jgi:hypothetical protein
MMDLSVIPLSALELKIILAFAAGIIFYMFKKIFLYMAIFAFIVIILVFLLGYATLTIPNEIGEIGIEPGLFLSLGGNGFGVASRIDSLFFKDQLRVATR